MRNTLTVIFASAVALAGCDSQDDPQSQPRSIQVRSAEQEQLRQLAPADQAIALRRAIFSAGYRCERVEEAGFVTTYENLDMWTASCSDGRQWAVFAGPDGSAQVRECADVVQAGLPECRITEDAEGAPTQNSATGSP